MPCSWRRRSRRGRISNGILAALPGYYAVADVKEVTIVWEEGGATSHHDVSDGQWEIFKLAFLGTGRIAILSEEKGESWMYDHRFLEAVS
jgi:hypothetical protein